MPGRTLAKAEPKTLRYRLLHTAARLVHGQRKRKIKIPQSLAMGPGTRSLLPDRLLTAKLDEDEDDRLGEHASGVVRGPVEGVVVTMAL